VTIPYTQKDLDVFLKQNVSNSNLVRSVLTRSRKGREVELLQIGKPGPNVEAVCFTCRHHACETMASFVVEGFVQAAISDTPAGRAFRKKYVLYLIPFVDKDGVEDGDQGKGRSPHDHNRDYGKDSIFPEIDAIEKLATEKNIKYLVDWHCPTLLMNSHQIFYFCGPKRMPSANYENAQRWSKEIKKVMPKDAPGGPAVWLKPVKPKDKGDLCSGFFAFLPRMVMATAIEVPFAPPGKKMDPASLRSYGAAFLKSWVQMEFVDPPLYLLSVTSGTATPLDAHKNDDDKYAVGTLMDIVAHEVPPGKVFDAWTGDTGSIENVYDPTMTFSVPDRDTHIAATYKDPGHLYSLTVVKGSGSGRYSGNTFVDINAIPAPVGQVFHTWQGDVASLNDADNKSTSITMPAKAVNLSAQYRSIDEELIGWWNFDDKAGSVIRDSTSNGNDLTIKGFNLAESSCPGKVGTAIRFDGADDSAIHPTLLNKMPLELTITCWVKPDATAKSGQREFLTKTNRNAYDQFFCRFNKKSKGTPRTIQFVYRIHGPGMTVLDSGVTVEDDEWVHYAVTWSAEGVKLYVNGELKANRNDPGPIGDGASQPLTIGKGFKGSVDELRIYGVPLKAEEIKALAL